MSHLKELDEEFELAKREPPVAANDLLLEILPLMQDYFVGEVTIDRGTILYRLPNGQKFRITAKQE